ncbi:extra-large guanine nucleotide-binding protein 1-like isoform X1 [Aristolochia californica]|uniref:extra-large guanine nucleotide-binding protein 1-like isoform X1 n=1 Tax=Aristolochia californica TaxID=171875 RepID=UPI0035DD619C
MAKLLRRMPPAEATFPVSEDEDEYSFAIEYNGPPIGYDIPRAVPIDIERIPTAAVVVPTAFGDRLALPVIQPLPSPDPLKAPTDDLVPDVESIVSPTSVIAFEESVTNAHDPDCSGDGSNVSSAEICCADAVDSSTRDNQACEMVNETEEMAVVGFSNKRVQSGELSVGSLGGQGIGASRALELSGEFGSLGAMSFSSRHDETQELSSRTGSSGVLRSSKDFKESVDFSNDTNPPDWISTESVLSSRSLSSEYSSHKASGRCDSRHASSVKRASLVTFCDSEDGEMVDTSVNEDEAESIQHSKKKSDWKVRKGACYRCLKGNRFTEKEACFVCNAKYCSNCVLRAMGSMPEGRKCLTCIGYPIDESKRESLGKCSRLLKRLLSSLEIQQVIKAEKSCEMNQLQPDNIFVNGKQLCHEEMVILQSCSNPPSKLKPGSYWYDKVSGFWGKEGQKPCKIISPHLNVGGVLMSDASNGNTGIFINNREITKSEYQMLKWAGVQCAGNPHFWLDADGSYQEEGQRNIRGNIWGKARTKLICSVLSLPVPSKLGNSCGEVVNQTGIALPEYFEQRILQKFLLVGSCGSGTSTIFKQARLLYGNVPYSDEEREDIKCKIQSNVYRYLGILLEGRERFEEESLMEARKHHVNQLSADQGNENHEDARTLYSVSPRLKAFSDWYLKVMASGNLEDISSAATREYTPSVEELWKDAAIQATFSRRSELHMLPTHASYFLEQVVDIAKMGYEPSDADILHAEGVTSANGLTCTDFSFPCSPYDDIDDDADQQDPLLRYQLIRVHAKGLGENCKWLEMFEDIRIVIFCVALSDYDVFCDNGSGSRQNKMLLNKKLFESIVTHQTFEQMDFLLVLSKFDLLEEKVGRVPLNVCDWLDDFKPVISRHNNSGSKSNVINETSMGQRAFHYIAAKFKRLFYSLTGRKLYVCQANGLEATSVDATLRFAREVIKWEEEKAFISVADNSVFSTEGSSFSH